MTAGLAADIPPKLRIPSPGSAGAPHPAASSLRGDSALSFAAPEINSPMSLPAEEDEYGIASGPVPGIEVGGSEDGGRAFKVASTRGTEIVIAVVPSAAACSGAVPRSAGALQPGQRSHVVFIGALQLQQ
jgi:hypothetical protein